MNIIIWATNHILDKDFTANLFLLYVREIICYKKKVRAKVYGGDIFFSFSFRKDMKIENCMKFIQKIENYNPDTFLFYEIRFGQDLIKQGKF